MPRKTKTEGEINDLTDLKSPQFDSLRRRKTRRRRGSFLQGERNWKTDVTHTELEADDKASYTIIDCVNINILACPAEGMPL